MSRTFSNSRSRTITKKSTTKITQTQSNEDFTNALSLSVVSWNISSAQPSQLAPNIALRSQRAPGLIRDECIRSLPDVIALQETSHPNQGTDMFGTGSTGYSYVSIGTQVAHHTAEYVDLLVKRELYSQCQTINLQNLPAVAATINLPNGTRIAVASLHLPHTSQAAPERKRMCEAIMKGIVSQVGNNIILLGDFNMRKAEDKPTEGLVGGGWMDAWKVVTNSDKSRNFTWNSHDNLYHGPDNFQFTCRFDRCYARGAKLALREFQLIGNNTVEGKGDYLSDHFGLAVRLDIANDPSNQQSVQAAGAQGQRVDAEESRRRRVEAAAARAAQPPPVQQAPGAARAANNNAVDVIALADDSEDEVECRPQPSTQYNAARGNQPIHEVDLIGDSDDEEADGDASDGKKKTARKRVNENHNEDSTSNLSAAGNQSNESNEDGRNLNDDLRAKRLKRFG